MLLKLNQQRKLCLHVVMKKIENFPEKPELPNFILPMITDSLILSHGFWVEKKCRYQSRLTFLSHRYTAGFSYPDYTTHTYAQNLLSSLKMFINVYFSLHKGKF